MKKKETTILIFDFILTHPFLFGSSVDYCNNLNNGQNIFYHLLSLLSMEFFNLKNEKVVFSIMNNSMDLKLLFL